MPRDQIAEAREAAPHPPDKPDRPEKWRRFLGLLQSVRATSRFLRDDLNRIVKAGEVTDATAQRREVWTALQDANAHYRVSKPDLEAAIAAIQDVEVDDWLFGRAGFEMRRLRGLWQRVVQMWPRAPAREKDLEPAEVLAQARAADAILGDLEYEAALISIPERLNEHLETIRTGGSLSFHETFKRELPSEAHRRDILAHIAAHPASIHGVVDLNTGRVIRASSKASRRQASLVGVVLLALLGGLAFVGVIANLRRIPGLETWPVAEGHFFAIAIAYVFLLAGAVAHVVIDAVKQARSGTGEPLSLEDSTLWFHVHERSMIVAVMSLWIALFVLALTGSTEWQTAFFAGYSVDSIVDVALARFPKLAETRTQALVTRLGES